MESCAHHCPPRQNLLTPPSVPPGDLADPAFQAELRAAPPSDDGGASAGAAAAVTTNIFFVRTSPEKALSALDACAVASAIEHNPRARVLLLSQTLPCSWARRLSPSLRVVRFSYAAAFAGHPRLARWYASGASRSALPRLLRSKAPFQAPEEYHRASLGCDAKAAA
jgi:hypothetical protein